MNPGDLLRNKHTQGIGLIISKKKWTIEGYGYGESIQRYHFEILMCGKDQITTIPYELLEKHWEIIDEN